MFIPRQTLNDITFCRHDENQTATLDSGTPVIAPAGSVVTITDCDGETAVVKKMDSCTQVPFGFLIQEVVSNYDPYYIPYGGKHPRDRGTLRDTKPGDPVAVASLGWWTTNVYDTDTQINAGDFLYATASGTLCVSGGSGHCQSGWNNSNPVAQALNTLTSDYMGRYLHIKLLV